MPPIDESTKAVAKEMYAANGARTKLARHELAAGQGLLELRRRIEANGVDWWKWYEASPLPSFAPRRRAERMMQWALADEQDEIADNTAQAAAERLHARKVAARPTRPPTA
jgi:hypothetical protein